MPVSCAPGPQTRPLPPGTSGDAVKISYILFGINPTTKETQPFYYLMLSNAWRKEFGSWAETQGATSQEPFRKVLGSPSLHENVLDRDMAALFDKIMGMGFGDLPHRNPRDVDLRALVTLHGPRGEGCKKGCPHRIITLQRGEFRRTVLFSDVWDSATDRPRSKTFADAFVGAERAIRKFPYFFACTKTAAEVERLPGGPWKE